MRIEPGHADYEAMYKRWKSDGGTQFSYKGAMWLAVQDNDIVAFVKMESTSSLDSTYGKSSFG